MITRLLIKVRTKIMSNTSESGANTKVYKLKSRRNFQSWKQKTFSMASSKGYERFLLEDVKIEDADDIELMEEGYINEGDEDNRRKKRNLWKRAKKLRKNSLEVAAMLTCSIMSKDLKMIAKCNNNPYKMFEVISKKYRKREDTDLTELLDDFENCKLKSRKDS